MARRLWGCMWAYICAVLLMPTAVNASDSELQKIIDDHWAWTLQAYPERRLEYGDRSGNRDWTAMSPEAFEERNEQQGQFKRRLETLEPVTLSAPARLNRQMLLRDLTDARDNYQEGLHLMAVNMRSGPQHRHSMAERLPFNTEQDYRDWLERLRKLPAQLKEYQALLDEGIARNRVQAEVVMQRVPDQIERVVVSSPEQSPFYKPFQTLPDTIAPEIAGALQQQAKQVIADLLNPAYAQFGDYISRVYLPATRKEAGVGSLNGGKALYRQLAAQFTTTELSPETIHQMGLDEVARIRREMMAIIDEVGFEGDLQAFNEFLRNDPQFYYDSPEALFEGYQAIAKRLDPALVSLFGKLPRMPYGVRPIPDEIAPDTTTAYYMRPAADGSRPGWYYVNLVYTVDMVYILYRTHGLHHCR